MDTENLKNTLQKEIDLLQQKFDELKVQASLGEKSLRDALSPEMEKIESQLAAARKDLGKLADVSLDAAGDIKDGIGLALQSITEAVKSAAARFR